MNKKISLVQNQSLPFCSYSLKLIDINHKQAYHQIEIPNLCQGG